MSSFFHQWQKLTVAARQAPAENDSAPYGFASRVTARASVPSTPPWMSLERFALRGFVAAAACCGGAFAFSFSGYAGELPHDLAMDETVSVAFEPIR